MAHTIKGAGGTCCPCELRVSCDECGGVCPGIQWRTRGGAASLIGWPEFCSPSNPVRRYRRQTYSGANHLIAYGDSTCAGSPGATADPGFSGYQEVDRLTGALTSTLVIVDSGEPYAPGPIASACGGSPGCESSLELTRLTASLVGLDNCCNIEGVWRRATGTRTQVLSTEDLDEDAVARLLLSPAGAWGAWSGAPLAGDGGGAFAYWQRREGGAAAFAYQEAEIRVAGTPGTFAPGAAKTAVVQVWAAPWGSALEDFRFSYDEEVGFFAGPDGSVAERRILIEPTKGFVHWARGCLIREGHS